MQLFNILDMNNLKILFTLTVIGTGLVNAYPRYDYGNTERLAIEGTSRDVDETRFQERQYGDMSFRNQWSGRTHTLPRTRYGANYRPVYQTRNQKPQTEEWDHYETKEPIIKTAENADLADDDVEMIDPGKASNQLAHLKLLPMRRRNEKTIWRYRNL